MTLDPKDGSILGEWGANLFYMPHGLTIDSHDNIWVTDVALHQAFKVSNRFSIYYSNLFYCDPFTWFTGNFQIYKFLPSEKRMFS